MVFRVSAFPYRWVVLALALVMFLATTACQAQTASGTPPAPARGAETTPTPVQMRVVTDFAGRQVAVPARIERVVTIGSLPVVNSFVFAMGHGNKIVSGLLPRFDVRVRDGQIEVRRVDPGCA